MIRVLIKTPISLMTTIWVVIFYLNKITIIWVVFFYLSDDHDPGGVFLSQQ